MSATHAEMRQAKPWKHEVIIVAADLVPLCLPLMTAAALAQLAWRLFAGALAIGAAVLISVTLGLTTQGVVASSLSILTGLSAATGAGFSHAVAFTVARRPASARTVALRAAGASLAIAIVVGVLTALIGSSLLPSMPVVWWHVAVALPLAQLGQLGLGLTQGLGQQSRYLTTYVSQPLTLFGVALIAAMVGRPSSDASAWSGPLVVLPFAAQAATLVPIWRALSSEIDRGDFRSLLSYTLRIYPSSLAHFLSYRLDLILVGGVLGAAPAGLYSLALNVVDAVARLGQSTATVLFPQFARSTTPRAAAILALRAAWLTGLLSFGATVLIALVLLVFGRDRVELRLLGEVIAILAVGGGGVSAWTVLASFLAASDRLREAALINGLLLVTSVALYVSLIPRIGLYGGAIGTSVGLFLAAVLGYRAARRSTRGV